MRCRVDVRGSAGLSGPGPPSRMRSPCWAAGFSVRGQGACAASPAMSSSRPSARPCSSACRPRRDAAHPDQQRHSVLRCLDRTALRLGAARVACRKIVTAVRIRTRKPLRNRCETAARIRNLNRCAESSAKQLRDFETAAESMRNSCEISKPLRNRCETAARIRAGTGGAVTAVTVPCADARKKYGT